MSALKMFWSESASPDANVKLLPARSTMVAVEASAASSIPSPFTLNRMSTLVNPSVALPKSGVPVALTDDGIRSPPANTKSARSMDPGSTGSSKVTVYTTKPASLMPDPSATPAISGAVVSTVTVTEVEDTLPARSVCLTLTVSPSVMEPLMSS